MTKLLSKRSDPISLHQNHKQELWSPGQSIFFEGYDKWFQETFKNQTNISSDIYFDSRNNLANSGYTGLECSPVINGDPWPQKPFMFNLVEESVLVCWLLGCYISCVFVFFSVILFGFFLLNSTKAFGHLSIKSYLKNKWMKVLAVQTLQLQNHTQQPKIRHLLQILFIISL